MQITIIIVVITCVVSYMSFSNKTIEDKLIFYPPAITERNEWYRFFSCGLIHTDIGHLAFNMFSFYFFGRLVEADFQQIFPDSGKALYVIMYVSALAICLLPTYVKHKDDKRYRSLGASGAVSAVVFVGIFLNPVDKIGLMFIPPIIPGFIFAPIYLLVSAYLDKKGKDNINHSAHIWGAIYGLSFIIVLASLLSNANPVADFFNQVSTYISDLFRGRL